MVTPVRGSTEPARFALKRNVAFTPFPCLPRTGGGAAERCRLRIQASSSSSLWRRTKRLPNQAVIRRWISPVSGKLIIEGTLRHAQPAVPYGDACGSHRVEPYGELASWSVNGTSAETRLNSITIEKGDMIDFLVDGKRDPENDAFKPRAEGCDGRGRRKTTLPGRREHPEFGRATPVCWKPMNSPSWIEGDVNNDRDRTPTGVRC